MKYSKVTISGKICTGKTTLFRNLQKKLKWPVFSTGQLFRQMAKDKNLSLESADEQNETVTKEVDYKVRDLLKGNKKIIAEGWMTGIMANDFPGILKVILTCDDKIRIKRFAHREKVSLLVAGDRISARENNLFAKLKKIYKRDDFVDLSNYDLVIDTSYLVPSAVTKKVLEALDSLKKYD